MRWVILPPAVWVLVICNGCASRTSPPPTNASDEIRASSFTENFRAAGYLDDAVELQALDKAERARSLAGIATDPERAPRTYVLCRMLFAARAGSEFREPMLGSAVTVGGGPWLLEPIAIQDGVPILVTSGYDLAGQAEPPLYYLIYCLTECQWTDQQYRRPPKASIRAAIEAFIQSHGIDGDSREWVLRQSE